MRDEALVVERNDVPTRLDLQHSVTCHMSKVGWSEVVPAHKYSPFLILLSLLCDS